MRIRLITTDDADFKRELDKWLAGATGAVEATDFERFCLWKDHTERGGKWESEAQGLMLGCGDLGDMQISLSLFHASVDGKKIVFYNAPSQVVDHRQVEAWIEKHMPASARRESGAVHKTDANNFHIVLH